MEPNELHLTFLTSRVSLTCHVGGGHTLVIAFVCDGLAWPGLLLSGCSLPLPLGEERAVLDVNSKFGHNELAWSARGPGR